MHKIKLTIQYDGTEYCGWQVQKREQRSIQGTIEEAIRKISGERVRVNASGRTDAGVHAEGQVAAFETRARLTMGQWEAALNSVLPGDIRITSACKVLSKFHPRFDAKSKHYQYRIYNGKVLPPFLRRFYAHIPYELDVAAMRRAARYLLGKHDFASFQGSNRRAKDTVRTIKRLNITRSDDNIITIDFEANGFLYNMARNIAGTLIEVGRKKLKASDIKHILNYKDRTKAGPTASAGGLRLVKVAYCFLGVLLFTQVCFAQDAREYNNAGVEFISKGEFASAEAEFRKSLEIAPDFSIARYNLGLSIYRQGRVGKAIDELERLVEESPHFVNARYNLGTIYLRENLYDDALRTLEKVVEMEPEHAEAHFNLAFIYYKKGILDAAITEYKKGLELDPDNLRGHLSLGYIYDKKKMHEEAKAEYNTALAIDPDAELVKEALQKVFVIGGLEKAASENPDDFDVLLHLGHVYYAKDMYREAAEAYQRALNLKPDNEIANNAMQKAVMAAVEAEE